MKRQLRSGILFSWILLFQIPFLLSAQNTVKSSGSITKPISFDRSRYVIPNKKFVLENGLTLIVHEDHSVPVVGVNLWYHVGSRNEKRGKTGFAHLFEHFFFNGSDNYPHGFREAMDDLGATNRNGTTNTDRTNFFEDVPVSALERTLFLEADRMGFLSGRITKEMLERERGVVQNEKRQGENQPYGRVFAEISGKIYPYSHPYSWSTIGSMDDLNAATLEDVKTWYSTYYGPNNAVISLAGDITSEKALELVSKYFGGITPGMPLARTENWIPALDRNIRDEMQDNVPQARIYRVYHAPAWKDKEIIQLDLFANILAGSKSSRLDRKLVYEKALATSVSAGISDRELGSIVVISATLKPGTDPALAEREMDAAMKELIEKGVSEEELNRAKSRNLSDFLRGMEGLGGFGGRADILAESATYGGSPDFYLQRLETLATAKPGDVKAAAQKWLTANHYTMVVQPFAKFKASKATLDRSVLPSIAATPEIKFPEVQKGTLKNGLQVLLLERHSAPIVNVTLGVDAGSASDPVKKAGIASLALDLMEEGTRSKDAFRISDELDLLGASLYTFNTPDMSFIKIEAITENLRASLGILADVVVNPSFPDDLFTIQKQRRLSQIKQEKAQPNALAQRILPALLFNTGHPYSMPFTGSGYESSVESITRADLVQWHGQWFKPGSATLIVTGDVTMDKLIPVLDEIFSNWKGGKAPQKNFGVAEKSAGNKVYLIDKPDAPQSTIVAAHLTGANEEADEIAIQTVMRNFGGIATSRLNRNLRLDKHWSYGTRGYLSDVRGQRPFIVVAPVQTDKTKEAMVEVIKEIRGVAGERELVGEEYSSIMRNVSLGLPGRFATLSALDDAAMDLINYKLPYDYWSKYAGKVQALKEGSLNLTAKKYVRPKEIIWIVIGDLKKVEKGVRELGYGDVVLLNTDGEIIK